MATAVRRHSIVNPARRHHAKARRKNKSRRHLSRAQIRAGFGGKRRKAALRANRAPKKSHRHAHRARAVNRRRTRRRNPGGEILVLPLANPARKRKSMAARHHRKARRHASASGSRRHNRRRHNPGRRRHNVRHHRIRHHRNPGVNVTSLFTEGLSALVGMAGSRLLTQAVLGTNNKGAYGYAGNAAATAVLAGLAHMLFKRNPQIRDGVIIGGTVGILARAMTDYTPFGGYLSQAGFGDYSGGGASGLGLYITTNEPTPSRFIGSSGQVEIPAGWAPTIVTTTKQPAAAGMGTYGRSRYSRY